MLKIKNVSLFLCIICFFYMIFEIIMNTQLTKLSVYYDIFRLIFFVPISYYFFRNIKFKKYFKVKNVIYRDYLFLGFNKCQYTIDKFFYKNFGYKYNFKSK